VLQYEGDKAGADALLAKYGKVSDAMASVMTGIEAIPVDVKPIYPLAGE
jgi:hypothetical protein